MVSKPQKQQRDGNHILRQTLNDSDILNYFSKGSGYFCMGERISAVTWHFIYLHSGLYWSHLLLPKKSTKYCTHFSKLPRQEWENRPYTCVMRAESGFQCYLLAVGHQSIDGQKTELPKDENGSEVHTAIDVKCCIQPKSRHTGNQFGCPAFSVSVNPQQLHQPGIWHNWACVFLIPTQILLILNLTPNLALHQQKLASSLP